MTEPTYDDSSYRKINESLLRLNDKALSNIAAEKVVLDFATFRGEGVEFVPDERKLPYQKEVIQLAFEERIAFLRERCCQEPNNAELTKDLDLHLTLRIYLLDFQPIDPEDEEIVRAANEWNKQLIRRLSMLHAKDEKDEYLKHAIESDEQNVHKWLAIRTKYCRRAEWSTFSNPGPS